MQKISEPPGGSAISGKSAIVLPLVGY